MSTATSSPFSGLLERAALLLAFGVLFVLGLNFTLAHDLSAPSPVRFLTSAALLAAVAFYFRVLVKPITALHRAAYRLSLTMALWSVAYALAPYPETFLYLLIVPALFFAWRSERKAGPADRESAGRTADRLAAVILYLTALLLYLEQAPLHAVLFPEYSFDWHAYYWNAPILLLAGAGLLRAAAGTAWHGLPLIGSVALMAGCALLASAAVALLTGAADATFLFVPGGVIAALLVVHAFAAWFRSRHASLRVLHAMAGLDRPAGRRLGSQMHGVCVFVAQVLGVAALFLFANDPRLPWVVILAIAIWLHGWPSWGIALALLQIAAAIFAAPMLFFEQMSLLFAAYLLAAELLVAGWLRRHASLHVAVPPWVFFPIIALALTTLHLRGFFQPSSLPILALLALAWPMLRRRRKRHTVLWWPVVVSVAVLCAQNGYSASFWSAATLGLVGLPLLITLACGRRGLGARNARLADLARRMYRGQWLFTWLAFAGLVAGGWSGGLNAWWQFATAALTLTIGCGWYLELAMRRAKRRVTRIFAAAAAELFLFALLALARWQLDLRETLELGGAVDGYALLGLAFIATGIRELLRRATGDFDGLLNVSATLYAAAGWGYLLYLGWVGADGYHAEAASMLMAALYWWFARMRHRVNTVAAMVFVNVALVIFFWRLELTNLQFYVMPLAATVLTLAQMFRGQLSDDQHRLVRMLAAVAIIGTSSFYNVVDFNDSVFMPLSAAVAAAAAVVVGIALRVRVYLYLGFSAFVFNALVVLSWVIYNQPPAQTKLMIGAIFLLIGLTFTGAFLAMQMKRQEILARYQAIREELASWD
ncbi:MAG: hypothetical protein AAF458_23580 [Pseudomonadota bacterium]